MFGLQLVHKTNLYS